jgi:superfamily I DNA and/or RNA helicase
VHRAFIDATAKQVRNNLASMMGLLKSGNIDQEYENTIPSLWATLFLAVPLISTTFASFSRLFSSVKCEEIGWLLMDESGQALPQAAVGALWRAQRAVVIGDPLQIEPVVAVPEKLIKSIFEKFEVEVSDWAPPTMSAQTLADRTSWFGSMIEVNDGDIWVGSPLRVHRRCSEPMFSVSNRVAYNGLMVSDTPDRHSQIGEVLGESTWLHIESRSTGKWSKDEGNHVRSMLYSLFDAGITNPDIFIITPFRNVADQLKNMLCRDSRLREVLGNEFVWKWAFDRIGTVHTFQGKEAEAVIFVLGASGDEYGGSRLWAGGSPNILNVAVTRAKQRLYVVGNSNDWQNAGVFRVLSSKLNKTNIHSDQPFLV